MAELPKTLLELKPWKENPRTIAEESFEGLKVSLERYGDIAGITFNQRTGRLVTGHQRRKALIEKYGPLLPIVDGAVVTPTGEKFPVRIVDWTEEQEKEANVAANNPFLAGIYTPAVNALLEEIKAKMPADLACKLRFERVAVIGDDDIPDPLDCGKEWQGMPEAESKDAGAWKTLLVNFMCQADYEKFFSLTGLKLLPTTRSIWFPEIAPIKVGNRVRYGDKDES